MKTQELWRLDELAEQCLRVVEEMGMAEGDSRRVRWDPNPRLLRYYTTLGLLDRAEKMVGRTAYYGRKHLVQLLAIKKLQQDGKSLNDIQALLLGKDASELCQLLGIENQPTVPIASDEPARRRFWERPHELPPVPEGPALTCSHFVEIEVAPGVTMRISQERFRELEPERLREALEPLQELLNGLNSEGGTPI